MPRKLLVFFCILTCSFLCHTLSGADIPAGAIKAHVSVLGSDSLEGRATGTVGAAKAAAYISDKLHAYGVESPAGLNGYYQEIPMHGSKTLPSSRLEIFRQDSTIRLKLGRDYLMYKTGAETFMPRAFPLVFVGYGIVAPEYDYNDYQSVDVEDKIVVFLDGEPDSDNDRFFEGSIPTLHSAPETKQRVAISRGARGSILIPDLSNSTWDRLARAFSFEDVRLAYAVSGHTSIVINPESLPVLMEDPDLIYEMDRTGTMRSFGLQTAMQFEGHFQERDFLARNVVGLVKGTDRGLRDSYILVSAHYDHLGIGPPVKGDSIYNGVSDNAAGAAVLLELARAFADSPQKPKRSLIFIFLTGEEKGLLGSTYYTDNPVVPLYKTIANINIDGPPIFEEFLDIVAIGGEYSTLGSDLEQFMATIGIGISEIPDIYFDASESQMRSDQFAFAKAGIPSVLIVEGLNYKKTDRRNGVRRMLNWIQNIYHSPFDDLNQPLNFDATAQYADIIFRFLQFLAKRPETPRWHEGAPFSTARIRSIIEKK